MAQCHKGEFPSLRRPIERTAQLLVEGRSAEIFFREMIQAWGHVDLVEARDFRGKNQLSRYLKRFVARPDFKEKVDALGIIRDADDDPVEALRAVRGALQGVGITLPPCSAGVVQTIDRTSASTAGDRPRWMKVGVFILPDCVRPGELETLCLDAVRNSPNGPDFLGCVKGYFQCLKDRQLPVPKKMDKARTWAFLATQNISDPLVGRAAQENLWPWDSPAFGELTSFLKALCTDLPATHEVS